jgi:hypothetical protein
MFKNIFTGAGCAFGGLLYLIAGISGLAIHLWTVLIALGEKGFIAALITLVTPPFAEIFWGFYSWKYITGVFFNTYTASLIAYVVIWGIAVILVSYFSSKIED